MAKGIEIGVASETKAFKQGIESGVIKPTEDAVDALNDLGKAKGPEQLERGLEDAQDATEKLKKETKETARVIEQEFRDSYRKMKDSSESATTKAKAGLNDVKSEAKQAGAEGAASFSGEWEDVGAFVQETLANGLSGFGPLGATAGIALALGFGTFLAQAQKDAEAAEERVSNMYDDMIDSKNKFLSEAYLSDAVSALVGDPEKLKEITKAAELTGLAIADVTAAYAGDADAIKLVDQALDDAADAQLALQKAQKDYNADVIVTARSAQSAIRQVDESTATAGKQASAYLETVDKFGPSWSAADKAAQKTAESVAKIGNKDVTVKVKGNTKQLELDIKKATVQQTLDLVINTIDRTGRKLP